MMYKETAIVIALIMISPAAYSYSCNVQNTACGTGSNSIFTMSSNQNAFLEKSLTPTYIWNLCCTKTIFSYGCHIDNDGVCNSGEAGIVSMSMTSNAFAEKYGLGNYPFSICCNEEPWDDIQCNVRNSCAGDFFVPIFSISANTNAFSGSSGIYPNVICCELIDNTPPIIEIEYEERYPSPGKAVLEIKCNDELSGCKSIRVDFDTYEPCIIAGDEGICEIEMNDCFKGELNYRINATDKQGNSNTTVADHFEIRYSDGCGCIINEDCFNYSCQGNEFCGAISGPEIEIEKESITIELGDTESLIIEVENKLGITDNVELQIYSEPKQLEYGIYFEGEEHNERTIKTVTIEQRKRVSTTLNIFGGKIGSYEVMLNAKSIASGLQEYERFNVNVVSKQNEDLTSKSPGLGIGGFVIILILSSFLIRI